MTTTVVFCLIGWILGWVVFGRPRVLMRAEVGEDAEVNGPPTALRRVVIIPARDEAGNIAELLGDLMPSTPADQSGAEPAPLVIVVDDHSSDDTAALAASVDGVVVVAAPEPPAGWTGKSWACWSGIAEAQQRLEIEPGAGGDLQLIFVDADVRMTPGALDVVTSQQRTHGGLMSVQPSHVPVRPYEQLSALFNVISVMGVGAGHPLPPTGAFGPVLATTLSDYQRVGGHRAVRAEVADDVALAWRYRDAGLAVNIRLGGDLIRFRMYPKGLHSLIEGWTKNYCTGAMSTRYLTLAAAVLWVTALGSAALGLLDAIAGQAPLLHVGIYGAFVAQLAVMFHRVGRFRWWTPLLYPVGLATFFGVFAYSTWRTLVRGSATWSGRSIDLSRHASAVDVEPE